MGPKCFNTSEERNLIYRSFDLGPIKKKMTNANLIKRF